VTEQDGDVFVDIPQRAAVPDGVATKRTIDDLSGPRGSERYLVERPASVPGVGNAAGDLFRGHICWSANYRTGKSQPDVVLLPATCQAEVGQHRFAG
jgi:hypothetical protein